MAPFSIDLDSVELAFDRLERPECVLCTRRSGMYVSHKGVGVLHIAPDGTRKLLGRPAGDDRNFVPNGIALRKDGTLLVANMGSEGGIWQIDRAGGTRPFLMECEGRPLSAANFVTVDSQDRVWISISTQTVPRTLTYNKRVKDGYVVVVDDKGPRVFSEGFGSTNECRLSPDEKTLYVVETFSRSIRRAPIDEKASPAQSELFIELGAGAYPDGMTFDSENHLWVTSIISNRLYRISPDARAHIVLEDNDPEHIARIEKIYQADALTLDLLHATSSKKLLPISSIAFGGDDLRTAYLGTTHGASLGRFRSPVAGNPLAHWNF